MLYNRSMCADGQIIRSRSNAGLKRMRAVLAGRERGVLVLEGERLVRDAIRLGCPLEGLFVGDDHPELLDSLGGEGSLVESALLQQASGLKTSPGVMALAPVPRALTIDQLNLEGNPLLLVVAGVADPGNLGALARSAEAAGVRALILLSGGTSPWNAKALRGSMGSLLRLPVVIAEDALQVGRELGDRGIRQAVAATRGGEAPASFDWKGPIALWVGSETGTLPDSGRGLEPLTIPMSGEVESLNVTVAASLLLFAAGREGSKAP
ncbi:MAG: RNA methyltransferase [Planctomycetota bacterium]|jgi:TrmH family RNA methyltransferase|nr:RNA methyltransferase [Planctomycetota bacterium]